MVPATPGCDKDEEISALIIDVMLMGGRLGEVRQRLEKDFSADPQTTAAGVHVALSYALRGEHLDAADALIHLLAAVPEGDAAVATAYRAQLDVMRGDRAAAMRKFDALLTGDNPGAIRHVYSVLAGRAHQDGDREAGDRLSLFILRRDGAPESLQKKAVQAYCAAAAGEHIGEYPDRVATLIEAGVPPTLLRAPLRSDFHRVLNEGDADVGDAMLGLARRLAALEEDAEAREQYQGFALDALVAAGDYAQALAMVDAGFRADNMEWRAAAVPKLRAHAALQADRKREAIEHFREFMGAVAAQGAAKPGATPHANLALNAARIGDLWQELGDEQKAKEAYREAHSHYTEALKSGRIVPAAKEELQQALEAVEGKIATEARP